MKLFIYEGNISNAYHNDGTLVVAAKSPEEALELVKKDALDQVHDRGGICDVLGSSYSAKPCGGKKECTLPFEEHEFDFYEVEEGTFPRLPDREVTLEPGIVAFNGGGYD